MVKKIRYKKKKYRQSKKKRFIKSLKNFNKKLNMVAEKKMHQVEVITSSVISTASASAILRRQCLIGGCSPVIGTGASERIGNKIFIRYLKVTIIYSGYDNTHGVVGKIGLVFLKERRAGDFLNVQHSQIFQNNFPIVNSNLLKSNLSKIKVTCHEVQSAAVVNAQGVFTSTIPFHKRWTKKIRVMKECTFDSNDYPNIPDYYFCVMWFQATGWSVLTTNPGNFNVNCVMTFTDI